jgi:hypothetical protein
MDKRTLGPGLEVSAIGLGCMGLSRAFGPPNIRAPSEHRAIPLQAVPPHRRSGGWVVPGCDAQLNRFVHTFEIECSALSDAPGGKDQVGRRCQSLSRVRKTAILAGVMRRVESVRRQLWTNWTWQTTAPRSHSQTCVESEACLER